MNKRIPRFDASSYIRPLKLEMRAFLEVREDFPEGKTRLFDKF
jgi:hypothetical protein